MNLRKVTLGAVLLALLAGLSAGGVAQAQAYWARCGDVKLSPERRIDSCTRLLNNGGGPNSEIAVLTMLGSVYRDMHQYEKAIDAYSRALGYEALGVSDIKRSTEAPGSVISMPTASALVQALNGRADVYALTSQADLALADAAHIFRLAPEAATSYATRCRIRVVLKTDLDKAAADCGQAMKLDPKNTQVLGADGLLQYRQGQLKAAAAAFDQALNIDPRLAGALYMRGLIELQSGNSTAGKTDIAAATEQDPAVAAGFSDLGINP